MNNQAFLEGMKLITKAIKKEVAKKRPQMGEGCTCECKKPDRIDIAVDCQQTPYCLKCSGYIITK